MTLNDFMGAWTLSNRTVIVCDAKYYDNAFDELDDINDGNGSIDDFRNYMEFAFVPYWSEFAPEYYLHPKYADAEVYAFYIGDTYIIVWLDIEDKFAKYEKVQKAKESEEEE